MRYRFAPLLIALVLAATAGCEWQRARELGWIPAEPPRLLTDTGKACVEQCRADHAVCVNACKENGLRGLECPQHSAAKSSDWELGYGQQDCGELCDGKCNDLLSLCFENCQ